jgi:hypothetical protein
VYARIITVVAITMYTVTVTVVAVVVGMLAVCAWLWLSLHLGGELHWSFAGPGTAGCVGAAVDALAPVSPVLGVNSPRLWPVIDYVSFQRLPVNI